MLQRVMHTVKDVTNIIEDLYPVVCGCVTRRKQSKPSNNQEQKQQSTQHRSTARSSADLTKLNQTPTLYTLAKDKIVLQITTPQAASSQRTHIARTQGCGRMHPVNRRVTTQYLCTQSVTTRRRCGRNGKHEAPCELSAHESIGIAADQVESTVSGAARGGGGETHTHTHTPCVVVHGAHIHRMHYHSFCSMCAKCIPGKKKTDRTSRQTQAGIGHSAPTHRGAHVQHKIRRRQALRAKSDPVSRRSNHA